MNKIEALKYICDNYHGSDGGFQFACLVYWTWVKYSNKRNDWLFINCVLTTQFY